MNKETTIIDAIRLMGDMIFTGSIEMLNITCKNDEQDWLDNLHDIISDESVRVMRDYFYVDLDKIETEILWFIADKFKDEKLVNELIEDQNAKREEEYNEFLSGQE